MIQNNPKPTNDVVFRKIFGSDENKDLLIALINAVVKPEIVITQIVLKSPFNLADYEGAKESILDIKAMDQDSRWYDVEIQMLGHVFYGKRATYYAAKTYVDQLEVGQPYASLNTTIGIHFLGYDMFPDDRVVRQFTFADVETNEHPEELSYLRLYFVELGKFHKEWTELATALDRWLTFLIHGERLHKENLPATLKAEPGLEKAVDELERFGADPASRAVYEGWEKAKMASVAELQYAEQQGIKLGQEQGILLGREQGIDQGRQSGQVTLLLRILTRQLGEAPAQIVSRVEALPSDRLISLGEALFDFRSYGDVEVWLSGSA